MLTRTLLACCLLLSVPALGQAPQSYSCDENPHHREFDFWLGDWEVTDRTGETRYGVNRISRESGGCLVLEDYTSAGGLTGKSINYYDPVSARWHQHWVDSSSSIIRLSGELRDGAMVLEGTIYYLASGKTAALRGVWTPLGDGRVRQFFEQANEDGEWKTWFDGYYRRQPIGQSS